MNSTLSNSTKRVDSFWDCLQVLQLPASTISAKMVYLPAVWYWAVHQLPNPPVNVNDHPSDVDLSIPPSRTAPLPDQATVFYWDEMCEDTGKRRTSGYTLHRPTFGPAGWVSPTSRIFISPTSGVPPGNPLL